MRLRALLAAFSAILLLLTGMFLAVHRGARGREVASRIIEFKARQATAEVRENELRRELEELRSRARIIRAAKRLGLHLPGEDELVILDLGSAASEPPGASP